ncbi:MAG: alpha/beta hydrolase, partial [Bacteroidales bacterium]|nr:alpha/beta hydrolase [Bacteroidales bacterium]
MRKLLMTMLLTGNLFCMAQTAVTFYAADSHAVYASLYRNKPTDPVIVLLHGIGSSREEFNQLAPSLNNLGYNVLSTDLRNGDKYRYQQNETSAQFKANGANMLSPKADIEAAIAYGHKKSNQPVVLVSSGLNASYAAL